jgi:hypothetical protein
MVIKNKKGMFFLMLTIVILSLFLLSVTFFSDIMARKSIQKRVGTLSDFVSSTELDLQRQLYIFGFRTIYLIQEEITDTGQPVSSVNGIFQEAFFNGTINGKIKDDLLGNAKFSAIESKVQGKAGKISATVAFSNVSISITQDDPWRLKVVLITNFTARDYNGLASWNRTLVTISYIPIEGFSDPLYFLETNGAVTTNITKTPFQTFVSGADTTNLSLHINHSYYKASTSAPSFIDRLEGNYFNHPNPQGIESFVYLPDFPPDIVQEKSAIDYIYFDSASHSFCTVEPSPSQAWFRLDNEDGHLANYNVNWPAVGCPL